MNSANTGNLFNYLNGSVALPSASGDKKKKKKKKKKSANNDEINVGSNTLVAMATTTLNADPTSENFDWEEFEANQAAGDFVVPRESKKRAKRREKKKTEEENNNASTSSETNNNKNNDNNNNKSNKKNKKAPTENADKQSDASNKRHVSFGEYDPEKTTNNNKSSLKKDSKNTDDDNKNDNNDDNNNNNIVESNSENNYDNNNENNKKNSKSKNKSGSSSGGGVVKQLCDMGYEVRHILECIEEMEKQGQSVSSAHVVLEQLHQRATRQMLEQLEVPASSSAKVPASVLVTPAAAATATTSTSSVSPKAAKNKTKSATTEVEESNENSNKKKNKPSEKKQQEQSTSPVVATTATVASPAPTPTKKTESKSQQADNKKQITKADHKDTTADAKPATTAPSVAITNHTTPSKVAATPTKNNNTSATLNTTTTAEERPMSLQERIEASAQQWDGHSKESLELLERWITQLNQVTTNDAANVFATTLLSSRALEYIIRGILDGKLSASSSTVTASATANSHHHHHHHHHHQQQHHNNHHHHHHQQQQSKMDQLVIQLFRSSLSGGANFHAWLLDQLKKLHRALEGNTHRDQFVSKILSIVNKQMLQITERELDVLLRRQEDEERRIMSSSNNNNNNNNSSNNNNNNNNNNISADPLQKLQQDATRTSSLVQLRENSLKRMKESVLRSGADQGRTSFSEIERQLNEIYSKAHGAMSEHEKQRNDVTARKTRLNEETKQRISDLSQQDRQLSMERTSLEERRRELQEQLKNIDHKLIQLQKSQEQVAQDISETSNRFGLLCQDLDGMNTEFSFRLAGLRRDEEAAQSLLRFLQEFRSSVMHHSHDQSNKIDQAYQNIAQQYLKQVQDFITTHHNLVNFMGDRIEFCERKLNQIRADRNKMISLGLYSSTGDKDKVLEEQMVLTINQDKPLVKQLVKQVEITLRQITQFIDVSNKSYDHFYQQLYALHRDMKFNFDLSVLPAPTSSNSTTTTTTTTTNVHSSDMHSSIPTVVTSTTTPPPGLSGLSTSLVNSPSHNMSSMPTRPKAVGDSRETKRPPPGFSSSNYSHFSNTPLTNLNTSATTTTANNNTNTSTTASLPPNSILLAANNTLAHPVSVNIPPTTVSTTESLTPTHTSLSPSVAVSAATADNNQIVHDITDNSNNNNNNNNNRRKPPMRRGPGAFDNANDTDSAATSAPRATNSIVGSNRRGPTNHAISRPTAFANAASVTATSNNSSSPSSSSTSTPPAAVAAVTASATTTTTTSHGNNGVHANNISAHLSSSNMSAGARGWQKVPTVSISSQNPEFPTVDEAEHQH